MTDTAAAGTEQPVDGPQAAPEPVAGGKRGPGRPRGSRAVQAPAEAPAGDRRHVILRRGLEAVVAELDRARDVAETEVNTLPRAEEADTNTIRERARQQGRAEAFAEAGRLLSVLVQAVPAR